MNVEELTLEDLTEMLCDPSSAPGHIVIDGEVFTDDDIAAYMKEKREEMGTSARGSTMCADGFYMEYFE